MLNAVQVFNRLCICLKTIKYCVVLKQDTERELCAQGLQKENERDRMIVQ